jgi:hypothetical protein
MFPDSTLNILIKKASAAYTQFSRPGLVCLSTTMLMAEKGDVQYVQSSSPCADSPHLCILVLFHQYLDNVSAQS